MPPRVVRHIVIYQSLDGLVQDSPITAFVSEPDPRIVTASVARRTDFPFPMLLDCGVFQRLLSFIHTTKIIANVNSCQTNSHTVAFPIATQEIFWI